MKLFKRILSAILLLCMIFTMIPPVPKASAAEEATYQLATGGIKDGKKYLIVYKNGNNIYALNGGGNPGDSTKLSSIGDSITLSDSGDLEWTFEETGTKTFAISNNGRYIKLPTKSDFFSYESTPFSINVESKGNGAYVIYVPSNPTSKYTLYQLATSSAYGYVFKASYIYMLSYGTGLYLYEKVEASKHSVSYDLNGGTGTAPATTEGLEPGSTYTIPEASEDLIKQVGNDTYKFWCWTEDPYGSGTEYRPGDTLTVDHDVKLYAQWYLQTQHTITVITDLNDQPTAIEQITGKATKIFVCLEGTDQFIELSGQDGIYSTTVADNGTYLVYTQAEGEAMEAAHGHKVIVYNQDGITELLNYSVTYEPNGGVFHQETINYHANTTVVAPEQVPTKPGYYFLGWEDQDGNRIAPGGIVAEKLQKQLILTAKWEELMNVTVSIAIHHQNGDILNSAESRDDLTIQLLHRTGDINQPIGQAVKLSSTHESYRKDGNISYYTLTFQDVPKGEYSISYEKSQYTAVLTSTNNYQNLALDLTYAPDNFDLGFQVSVALGDLPQDLLPKSVNLYVTRWNGAGWHDVSATPVNVPIGTNGIGFSFLPVWKNDNGQPCYYRVRVSSFVMPDGNLVAADCTEQNVIYRSHDSGLYTAEVVVYGGQTPEGAHLSGAYYGSDYQNGSILVNVYASAFTVTFDAGEGQLNGQNSVVLQNQFAYPNLQNYHPQAPEGMNFEGWYIGDELAENRFGKYLTGSVTYVAKYSTNRIITGTITANSTYTHNGETATVHLQDRAQSVVVVLQKSINGVYNDVDSCLVPITYNGTEGIGSYTFKGLPDDGTAYRVQLHQLNYAIGYDNNADSSFQPTEYDVTTGNNVDIQLQFKPDAYEQLCIVDASRISADYRPIGLKTQILYRDLGSNNPYTVISQHKVNPYGLLLSIPRSGRNSGSESVWKWHTAGSLYEYQLLVTEVYGEAGSAFSPEGTPYTEDMPFTLRYDLPSYYMTGNNAQSALRVTLIPKEYRINFDLATDDPVEGMHTYLVDSNEGMVYAYTHTWGTADLISAYPYRPGYVFKGWSYEQNDNLKVTGGKIEIDAELAGEITLTANWEPLNTNTYAVRYLNLYTNDPVLGATVVSDVRVGDIITLADVKVNVEGYTYAGAMVRGEFFDETDVDVQMQIRNDHANEFILYYTPEVLDESKNPADENLALSKDVTLENNGTYSIELESYAKTTPIHTTISYSTPLDIVLVLDQSGSMNGAPLEALKKAVDNFITLIGEHAYENGVDHRMAIVGYANTDTGGWVSTGVYGSHGDFHKYGITGYTYQPYTGDINSSTAYYTKIGDRFLLLTYHDSYYHLISEQDAHAEALNGGTVYGYAEGEWQELTRNTSGMWLYGNKRLYSDTDFYTYHTNVYTHRDGIGATEVHGYLSNNRIYVSDGHDATIYTRTVTTGTPETDIYVDAMVPVTTGANGSGVITPGLKNTVQNLSSGYNAKTYVNHGMEMANRVFAVNPIEGERKRIVIVFTDGKPGDDSNFDENTANEAIRQANIAYTTYGAEVYAVGMYLDTVVEQGSMQDCFMNGLSSNYPNATKLEDVWASVQFEPLQTPYPSQLNSGGPHYIKVTVSGQEKYYPLAYKVVYSSGYYNTWGYTTEGGTWIEVTRMLNTQGIPTISTEGILVADDNTEYQIYRKVGVGYNEPEGSGFYTVNTTTEDLLTLYFAEIVKNITTTVDTEVVIQNDTIMRDIMGQGLVLTPGTEITVYRVRGAQDAQTDEITWSNDKTQLAQLTIPENPDNNLFSTETTHIVYHLEDGTEVDRGDVPIISVYNLQAENPLTPNEPNYHPHTIDINGYIFDSWYVSPDNPESSKLLVTITRVEARDEVVWGRSTTTNHPQSGLWLPATDNGTRNLLMAFEQPTTIFVERAYVLDYGKAFTLSGWYFDDQGTKEATAIHVDCDIESGMNLFDPSSPSLTNGGTTGNTSHGNITIENGQVTYTPVSTQWGGYDSFYVFGNTWRKTVLAQDANYNGNLWNKVTVIPASNVYYEDSFVTEESGGANDFSGFSFSGTWETVYTDDNKANAGQNKEDPEHQENPTYGNVHGWTDDLSDDKQYSDGSAHMAGAGNTMAARATFRFTGTGVDIYTRTNDKTGMVVAMLKRTDADAAPLSKSIAMDNLSMSGNYYQIPTLSFADLPYGTYEVTLIATAASAVATGEKRYEYYLDGIRVYNPLGSVFNHQSTVVKNAYGRELNPVYTEIRDIVLTYGDFNYEIDDNEQMGAVFIDWVKDGQQDPGEQPGTGVNTYQVGTTFNTYGPKNEIYLTQGQAIVLKVDPKNTYYVGMKTINGKAATVNVSGLNLSDPVAISVGHTTDMYYEVTPMDGYIVIQNYSTNGALLALTKLRTTNMFTSTPNNGIIPVSAQDAVASVCMLNELMAHLAEQEPVEVPQPQPIDPSLMEEATQAQAQVTQQLFTDVRSWLDPEEGGAE